MHTDVLHFWAMVVTVVAGVVLDVMRYHGVGGLIATLQAEHRRDALIDPYHMTRPTG